MIGPEYVLDSQPIHIDVHDACTTAMLQAQTEGKKVRDMDKNKLDYVGKFLVFTIVFLRSRSRPTFRADLLRRMTKLRYLCQT
jgi:hypothetical protein